MHPGGCPYSVKAAYSHGSWIKSGCRSGSDAGGCIKRRRQSTNMNTLQISGSGRGRLPDQLDFSQQSYFVTGYNTPGLGNGIPEQAKFFPADLT